MPVTAVSQALGGIQPAQSFSPEISINDILSAVNRNEEVKSTLLQALSGRPLQSTAHEQEPFIEGVPVDSQDLGKIVTPISPQSLGPLVDPVTEQKPFIEGIPENPQTLGPLTDPIFEQQPTVLKSTPSLPPKEEKEIEILSTIDELVYDFGGAEFPEEGAIVVDISGDINTEELLVEEPNIVQDISKPFQLKHKAKKVNVSMVLRYIDNKEGFLEGDKVPTKKLEVVADNINKNLKAGGTTVIFDHEAVAEPVVTKLKELGFKLKKKKLINEADEDFPAEFRYDLTKPVESVGSGGMPTAKSDITLQPARDENTPANFKTPKLFLLEQGVDFKKLADFEKSPLMQEAIEGKRTGFFKKHKLPEGWTKEDIGNFILTLDGEGNIVLPQKGKVSKDDVALGLMQVAETFTDLLTGEEEEGEASVGSLPTEFSAYQSLAKWFIDTKILKTETKKAFKEDLFFGGAESVKRMINRQKLK